MRVRIEAEIVPRDGETQEQLEERVEKMLSFDPVRDAFEAADVDLQWIQLVGRADEKILKCDALRECVEEVTHIDNKGFVYCTVHGERRRRHRPCRKLRPQELDRLKRGQTLERY